MKIGVVSDSHISEPGTLPHSRLARLFKGIDILLHAGDVCELHVLEELQEMFTLTFAVWGEGDSDEVRRYVEEKRVVRFGGRAVGMIHGHQYTEVQRQANRWLNRLLKRAPDPGTLEDFLLAQFEGEEVDAIVFGHTHVPYVKMHKGVLLFNPGAARTEPDRRRSARRGSGQAGPARQGAGQAGPARQGAGQAGPERQASAGILEVDKRDIIGRIRYL